MLDKKGNYYYDIAMFKIKTKKERTAWFYSLTDEARENWINKKRNEKTEKRLEKLRNYKNVHNYNCIDCFHSKSGNCKEIKTCKYYCNIEHKFAEIEVKSEV